MAITKLDISMLEDVSGADSLVKLDANAKIPAGLGTNLLGLSTPVISASDPAIDSNKALGTEWLNSTSGEMYICTDATAGSNKWINVGAGTGDIEPVKWYGPRGAWGGGHYPTVNNIDYITIATTGNAVDFGDLLSSLRFVGGFSGDGRGVFVGGEPPASNVMQYVTLASPGNAVDFGDTTTAAGGTPGGLSNGVRGIRIGGGASNVLDYVAIATTGNATDFGDATAGMTAAAGLSNGTYGLWAGGNYPNTNNIDKINVATAGNAIDWADQTSTGHAMASVGNETRGIWMGGYAVTAQNSWQNIIQYLTIATQANTVDFGDLLNSPSNVSGVTDATKGVCGAGAVPGTNNIIQYVTIASTGNAVDFGDMTVSRYGSGAVSG